MNSVNQKTTLFPVLSSTIEASEGRNRKVNAALMIKSQFPSPRVTILVTSIKRKSHDVAILIEHGTEASIDKCLM